MKDGVFGVLSQFGSCDQSAFQTLPQGLTQMVFGFGAILEQINNGAQGTHDTIALTIFKSIVWQIGLVQADDFGCCDSAAETDGDGKVSLAGMISDSP